MSTESQMPDPAETLPLATAEIVDPPEIPEIIDALPPHDSGMVRGARWRGAPVPPPPPLPPAPPSEPPPPPGNEEEEEVETVKFGSKLEESEMDVTPMVDIVFQLLIFFMVTASFSLQKSLQIPKPKDDRPSAATVPQEDDPEGDMVTVFVDSFNTYRVETPDWEEEAPSEQDLIIKLRRARLGNDAGKIPTRLMVKASGDASHSKVVAALDAGTAVGMEQLQLQTVEQDDE
ncbi:MAG: biopolymer transporter ExbD [Pirellulales bacterium]